MAQPVASPSPQDTLDHPTALADRRWLVLAVVAVAQLMVVLDSTADQSMTQSLVSDLR